MTIETKCKDNCFLNKRYFKMFYEYNLYMFLNRRTGLFNYSFTFFRINSRQIFIVLKLSNVCETQNHQKKRSIT